EAHARARSLGGAARPDLQDPPRPGAGDARADEAGAEGAHRPAADRDGRQVRRAARPPGGRCAGESALDDGRDARADHEPRAPGPYARAAAEDGPDARAPWHGDAR